MEVFLVFVVGVAAIIFRSAGALEPVCKREQKSYYGPKLPQLPDAFTTSIEANFANRNYTVFYTEYYDLHGNRGAVHRTRNGQTIQDIYNYNQDEKIAINEVTGSCVVQPIDLLRRQCRFSFFGGNGSHIESVAALFKFGARWDESYEGVKDVRGIKCFHWRSCVVPSKQISYTLDYYFSLPDWAPNTTLVRAEINGTAQNTNCTNGTYTPMNGTHSFFHVYDFINFKTGVPDPVVFQPPRGYFCEGYKSTNRSQPRLPPAFSVMVESVNRTNKTVWEWKEVYDFGRKLFMLKYQNRWHPELGEVSVIYDYNSGVGYNISLRSMSQCKMFALESNRSVVTTQDDHHHIRMKTAQELLFGTNRSAMTYLGSSTVRGIDVDIWSSRRQSTTKLNSTYTIEWSFSKPTWDMKAGNLSHQHQVPVRIDIYSKMGHLEMNMFNFDGESVTLSTFDVRPCFDQNKHLFVYFRLDADFGKYGKNQQFIMEFALMVASTANVSALRVSGLQLLPARSGISANFVLLDKPALHSHMMQYVRPEKRLKEASEALKTAVTSGKFKVDLGPSTVNAISTSYFDSQWPFRPSISGTKEPTKPSDKPAPGKTSKNKSKGVAKGAVAGVAFVMLVVGILGGLGVAHIMMKRRGTRLFQYQRQT